MFKLPLILRDRSGFENQTTLAPAWMGPSFLIITTPTETISFRGTIGGCHLCIISTMSARNPPKKYDLPKCLGFHY